MRMHATYLVAAAAGIILAALTGRMLVFADDKPPTAREPSQTPPAAEKTTGQAEAKPAGVRSASRLPGPWRVQSNPPTKKGR
jgi:hypothetical protein